MYFTRGDVLQEIRWPGAGAEIGDRRGCEGNIFREAELATSNIRIRVTLLRGMSCCFVALCVVYIFNSSFASYFYLSPFPPCFLFLLLLLPISSSSSPFSLFPLFSVFLVFPPPFPPRLPSPLLIHDHPSAPPSSCCSPSVVL